MVLVSGWTVSAAFVPNGTLNFDSTADGLYSAAVPSNPTSFTVCLWFRRKSGNPATAFFWEIDGAGYVYALGTNSNALTFWDGQAGFSRPFGDGPATVVDKWYFMAFVATSATTGAFYWGDETTNVTLIGSGAIVSTLSTLSRTTLGSRYGFDAFRDQGRTRTWNAQLSMAELELERKSGNTPVRTLNLTADWQTVSNANKLIDSSGNGNSLTASGAGPWSDVAVGPNPV